VPTSTNATTIPADRATVNATTVGSIYAAFGSGDVESILAVLSDDIVWDDGIRATALPWLQPGLGKQHVLEFFGAVAAGLQFMTFEPVSIVAGDDVVVAVIRENAVTVASGGSTGEDLFVHMWRFDARGRVVWFRHIGDWARHEAAFGA
jgi:uncharacterized protein